MIAETAAREVMELMQKDFGFPLKERLHVAPEVRMYRTGEDESVWSQEKNEKFVYQVYFDGEYVCSFSVDDSKEMARLEILKGLLKLYKEKKIFWNKFLYEVNKPKKVEEPQLPEAKTKEEKILQEVVKHATKKKKKGEPLIITK